MIIFFLKIKLFPPKVQKIKCMWKQNLSNDGSCTLSERPRRLSWHFTLRNQMHARHYHHYHHYYHYHYHYYCRHYHNLENYFRYSDFLADGHKWFWGLIVDKYGSRPPFWTPACSDKFKWVLEIKIYGQKWNSWRDKYFCFQIGRRDFQCNSFPESCKAWYRFTVRP